MRWLFRRLFRPTNLVLLAGLTIAVAALLVWPRRSDQVRPLPVKHGDQEVVWLNHAPNVRDWERFVTAVGKADPSLKLEVDDSRAFPRETTEVPEIRVRPAGKQGWLLFRWYKLTGDLKTADWVAALTARQPPPLAIIGGNNSQNGLRLARELKKNRKEKDSPLFLITQASAEKDPWAQGEPPLIDIYKGRTFRFCFSNLQMARIVTEFVWNRDHLLPATDPLPRLIRFLWNQDSRPPANDPLRPDVYPAYMPIWNDDPFSVDLADSFLEVLQLQAVRDAIQDWVWLSGFAWGGGLPLQLAGARQFRPPGYTSALQWRIFYSAGSFSRPNPDEEDTAESILGEFLERNPLPQGQQSTQPQALLVLPATSQPARRFLRALRKSAPVAARHFVVVTADSIEFNKIYRDRNLTWPIQDLPLKLVFFCHRNPVDRNLGFREQESAREPYNPDKGSPTSGTEDLLLFIDVVEAVVQAAYPGPRLLASADKLAANLHKVKWKNERLLFNDRGNRHGGTGEHVVYLRPPQLVNNRVAPRAELEIWYRSLATPGTGIKFWNLRRFLTLTYGSSSGEGGLIHAGN
jgi:hypothetical protein